MASFASSATTCGARKHAWTNNGQLPSVHHHGWRTLARLDQHIYIYYKYIPHTKSPNIRNYAMHMTLTQLMHNNEYSMQTKICLANTPIHTVDTLQSARQTL